MNSLISLFNSMSGIALIVTVLVSLSLLMNMLFFWHNRRLATILQQQSAKLIGFDQRLNMIASGSLSIGDRVVNLEAELAKVEVKQDSLANNDSDFSYTQAMTMLQQGIEPEMVAVNCGLSQSEVGLMALLYRNQQHTQNQRFAAVS